MTRIIGGLAVLAALGAGCAGQSLDAGGTGGTPNQPANGTGGASADAQSGGAATGGTAGTTTSSGGAATGGTAGTAAPSGGASGQATSLPQCSEIPQEVAPRQTVTVAVRNDTAEDRYLITEGLNCTPFAVSVIGDAEATDLRLRGYGIAGGGCAGTCGTWAPATTQVVLLRPNDSYLLAWDARASVGCLAPMPECPVLWYPVSALQPVPPGDYRITLHMNISPPPCNGQFPYAPGCEAGSTGCSLIPKACTSEASASVDFALPASGDLTVALPLT